MREYVTPPRVRGIVAAALIAVLALGNLFAVPSVVLAEAAAKKHAPKEAVAPPPPSDDYLASLLDEINARRESVGTPPLTYATEDANEAVSQYLADLTPPGAGRTAPSSLLLRDIQSFDDSLERPI